VAIRNVVAGVQLRAGFGVRAGALDVPGAHLVRPDRNESNPPNRTGNGPSMYLSRGLGEASSTIAIAQAIATAEGGLTPGTFPYRTNNPCDVFVGGSTAGYSTMAGGWQACYNQIDLMVGGGSSVYTPDESISDIAASWAPASAGNNPANWASIVASQLGLSPSDPLTAVGGVVAQTSTDSTTGLPVASTGDSADSTPTDSDLTAAGGIALTDGSGNLTGWGWGAIALGLGLVVWVAA
jgi:hypothetical protein